MNEKSGSSKIYPESPNFQLQLNDNYAFSHIRSPCELSFLGRPSPDNIKKCTNLESPKSSPQYLKAEQFTHSTYKKEGEILDQIEHHCSIFKLERCEFGDYDEKAASASTGGSNIRRTI